MKIDFPLVLVVLTFATGLIWLADRLFLRKRRLARAPETAADPVEADEEKKEPYLVELSKSFFPVLAVVLILRSFLVEPFQIPSGSMLPTLEVGDFILVNKYAYGLRLPVAGTKIVEVGEPERGDVMVFRFPEDRETNYIKRVIGLPGDTIRYQNRVLTINGEKVPEAFVASYPQFEVWLEKLGTVEHDILQSKRAPRGTGQGEWVVPENSYFVMGDNRDNSNDSRFWGYVPEDLVVGKAFAIWMHWQSLFSLPSFSRVGAIE